MTPKNKLFRANKTPNKDLEVPIVRESYGFELQTDRQRSLGGRLLSELVSFELSETIIENRASLVTMSKSINQLPLRKSEHEVSEMDISESVSLSAISRARELEELGLSAP